MKRIATKYVAMNPRRCVACWECVEKCPKHVIGKVGFLWHKHVAFKDAEACIGCNKCVKTCPHGVFFKPDEAPLSALSDFVHRKTSFTTKWMLPLAFVASAVSGIGLHIAEHGTSHEVWHNWAVAHVLLSLLWLISVACHIKRHRHWYKSIVSKGIGKKSPMTLVLSAAFLIVTVTGIVLMACVDRANSAVGLWHYKIGLLLIVFSLIHIIRRKRRG